MPWQFGESEMLWNFVGLKNAHHICCTGGIEET